MKSDSSRILHRLVAVASLGLLLAAAASAQAPEGPQSSTPSQGSARAPSANPKPAQPQQKPQESGTTISVEVPVVTLDVIATTQGGDLLLGLKKENFRILEDGQPQTITNFGAGEAPITMVVLMEFSARYNSYFSYVAKYWSDALFPALKPQDWLALVTFDMRPRLEVDFTQNKDEVRQAIQHLYFPSFSESNVFDALLDTVDRLKDVKGKKSILLICTGRDTFSKHTYDQTLKALRGTDVTVFIVGLSRYIVNALQMGGRGGSEINFAQDQNEMNTIAHLTGGYTWFPQMTGELPSVFHEAADFLRHQYSITYTPTNTAADGRYRKIKVELVAPDGGPLTPVDQKGKKHKWVVYAKEGYTAPKGGVGD